MPFWSKRSRAEKVCTSVPAYEVLVPLGEWRSRWLPGYDLTSDEVLARLDTTAHRR